MIHVHTCKKCIGNKLAMIEKYKLFVPPSSFLSVVSYAYSILVNLHGSKIIATLSLHSAIRYFRSYQNYRSCSSLIATELIVAKILHLEILNKMHERNRCLLRFRSNDASI